MFLSLLDFLFPPRCPGCNRPGSDFCSSCRAALKPANPPPLPGLDEIRAAGLHEGPLRHAIGNLKFRARLAQVQAVARLLEPPPGLLVPVPSPFWRRHRRGFNLAELLARALERPWQALLTCPAGLSEQKSLSLAERLHSRRFQARAAAPECVVLVDDVLTTGATLMACSTALRQAGARQVRAAVVAWQPRRDVHIEFPSSAGRAGKL